MKPQDTTPSQKQPLAGPSILQFSTDDVLANLLPVIALRPSRILHLRTEDKAQEQAATLFRQVLQALTQEPDFKGWQPKFVDQVIKASPEVSAVKEAVAGVLLANPGMGVNFSGGGTLLSVGAYLAAMLLNRSSVHCDAATLRLSDGRTGRALPAADGRELVKKFSLRLWLALEGRNLSDWRGEKAPDALRAFGLKAYELRNQHWGVLDQFNKSLRAHFYSQNDRLPNSAEELTALLTKPLPAAASSTEPGRQMLAAAKAAGLVREDKLIAQATRRSIERTLGLITHGWIELAVLDCLLRNPRFLEVTWAVEPVNASADNSEPDILCLDQQLTQARLICCRASLTRPPMDVLEGLAERARRIGARAATLVVFKPAPGQESAIRSLARKLDIDVVLEADEIVKAFSPSAK
jgi:hypothetical protein